MYLDTLINQFRLRERDLGLIVSFLTLIYFSVCSAFFGTIDNFILHSSIDIPVLLSVLPIKVYDNADTKKVLIFKDNRGKAGVYR